MTKNDSAPDRQGGLPDDLGNDMSERSGYYDESETGMTDTPIGRERQPPEAVPEHPKDTDDSGTTFDADTGTGREL
ncbi:hypothetical protein ACFP9V_04695 [Deinococcus radiopugnans]|uniref:Uncharacterized protein n=1 Tax=Deinococcus radiopugnans ATCC 19172 TaxID=585398 RepID=A0A5C4YBP6_9DEIO|nr:hypothetical protein [Deinococcus radiopugnans]MBB6015742.1 hypothetical protein [Deinococcus radiopugnans ATCC 19172]TNM72573.1 hypothetical protein FHR04_01695 [Deinococcus radiopugnans ATCC 19172]